MEEIIITQKSGEITANFEAVKAQLNEQLALYRNLVFTEEEKKKAKDTVAELRKGKKELADRCKEVKKEYMMPFDAFMEKADELAKMFDEPINLINEQIEAFEQKRIEEKKEIIKSIYAELVPEEEFQHIIPLNKIYNVKWENATFAEKAIKDEVMTLKLNAKSALETIKAMHSDIEERAIELYKSTLNVTEAVLLITNYENQKKEIMERERIKMREAEEERIRAEERRRIEEEQRAKEELENAVQTAKAEAVEELIPTDFGAVETAYQYTMMLTPDAKEKVEMFLNSIGIEFYGMEVED